MTNCLFCGMVAGEVPANVVLETDRVLAFRDINPQAPIHVLLVPKRAIPRLGSARSGDEGLLGEVVEATSAVARQEGLVSDGADEPGYRLVTNTGPEAGQTVFHVHVHVLGGRGMGWPPWPAG